LVDKQHETFGPIFRLQDAEKCNDVLRGRIANHITGIPECVQDGGLDKGNDLLGSTEDEASIILEEVTCDGPDTILLLREGGKDVC